MFGTDFLLLQLLFLCYFGEAVLNTILKNKFTREALEERIFFYMGKRTRIALQFIFITHLERIKLSLCMSRDKKAMQGTSMDYTHFTQS
jgi:hypothetical protein